MNFVDTGTDEEFMESFMRLVPKDGQHFRTYCNRGRLEVVHIIEGVITFVIAGHADRDDMAEFWRVLNGGWIIPTATVIPKACYPELSLINAVGHHRGLWHCVR